MHFEYATLERLLVRLFNLSESQRGALTGRFKYLQRHGALGSLRIERGRTRYGIEQILRCVIIFELIDIGCTPTRALRIVRTHWAGLRINLAHAWQDVRRLERDEGIDALMWTVVPHALQELGATDGMADVMVSDAAGEIAPAEMTRWPLKKPLSVARHAMFLNLPQLLAACCEALAGVDPLRVDAFRIALERLAQDGKPTPLEKESLLRL